MKDEVVESLLNKRSISLYRVIHSELTNLKFFTEAITAYELSKKIDMPFSTAHYKIQQYLMLKLITLVKEEKFRTGMDKKYYQLSDLGYETVDLLDKVLNLLT